MVDSCIDRKLFDAHLGAGKPGMHVVEVQRGSAMQVDAVFEALGS